jgi:hypothetical protein
MKTWIAMGQMSVLGTRTVAAKDAPMVPDMHARTLAFARATLKGTSKHGQKRRGRTRFRVIYPRLEANFDRPQRELR